MAVEEGQGKGGGVPEGRDPARKVSTHMVYMGQNYKQLKTGFCNMNNQATLTICRATSTTYNYADCREYTHHIVSLRDFLMISVLLFHEPKLKFSQGERVGLLYVHSS